MTNRVIGRATGIEPQLILITGRNGQVSWELRRTLQSLGRVVALGSRELDLRDPAAIRARVRELRPQVIVNAAAYTAVDKAETDQRDAEAINATAPGVLGEEAKAIGALLIHYSTDYVFDGLSEQAYREDDSPNPQGVYGATKLAGEQAIVASGARHLILRTSWVYGARGGNFLLTILRLAAEREELKVVADQIGSPTWSRTIAEATAAILAQCLSPMLADPLQPRLNRIYHLTSRGHTSWHGFAQRFIDLARERGDAIALQRLLPITSSEYPTAASRPPFSLLSSDLIADSFGIHMPDWRDDLALVMEAGR